MELNDDANLDPSQVEDLRGSRGGGGRFRLPGGLGGGRGGGGLGGGGPGGSGIKLPAGKAGIAVVLSS